VLKVLTKWKLKMRKTTPEQSNPGYPLFRRQAIQDSNTHIPLMQWSYLALFINFDLQLYLTSEIKRSCSKTKTEVMDELRLELHILELKLEL